MKTMLRRLLPALIALWLPAWGHAQALGSAPRHFVPQFEAWSKGAGPPLTRADVVLAYNTQYLPSGAVALGWTGNVTGCVVGTLAPAYEQATLMRINFFRRLAGLPGNVTHYADAKPLQARAAALIMDAQNALNHNPPPEWACYSSDGAAGAAKSNLALGYNGIAALDGYMDDAGAGNTAVGHRRWILYPPQASMGVGNTSEGGHALWVLGPFGSRPATPGGVAWPPQGFVPYQVLPATSNRWSLSYPGANFSSAQVSMTRNGVPLGAPTRETLANGYGDNTLVWRPVGVSYAAPSADITYRVSITGVSGSGVPASFQYDVIVIDPAAVLPGAACDLFCHGFEN